MTFTPFDWSLAAFWSVYATHVPAVRANTVDAPLDWTTREFRTNPVLLNPREFAWLEENIAKSRAESEALRLEMGLDP